MCSSITWLSDPTHHFTEPSHDLNNQTVLSTDVYMAEWSEHKTEDLRLARGAQFESMSFATFCIDFHKKYRCRYLMV